MDLDYIVIAALLVNGLYVSITGLIMDLFGTPQFLWHSYAGYASVGLAGLHLGLNWRRVIIYLRRRLGLWSPRRDLTPQKSKSFLGRRGFLAAVLGAIAGFILGRWFSGWRLEDTSGQTIATQDVGQLYHTWSKPGYASILGTISDWGSQPARYKHYPEAEQIVLPEPGGYQSLSLEQAIEQRRSQRDYTDESLALVELSRLLHAASGITDPARGFRAAPSAGALYPIEIYLAVHNVSGLEPGLYHFAVVEHALEQLQTGDLRTALVRAGIGQELLGQAGVCFVLSAIFQRTRWRYRERTYRYVMLEAGHIGQNLYLAATSLGLGACAVGAFWDDDINVLLGLDGEAEAALYLIPVGKI